MRPVYTAANADAAQTALLELAESDLGRQHKAAIAVWERAWERFTPFLEFPPDLRKVIYTTNTIESLNFQGAECRGACTGQVAIGVSGGVESAERAHENDRGTRHTDLGVVLEPAAEVLDVGRQRKIHSDGRVTGSPGGNVVATTPEPAVGVAVTA